ncbi:putative phosphoglycerate kinase, tRNA (guanine-N-7) methyltransferase, Trmb type [Dioscorea sansibarensis]
MSWHLNFVQTSPLQHWTPCNSDKFKLYLCRAFCNYRGSQSFSGYCYLSRVASRDVLQPVKKFSRQIEDRSDGNESNSLLHIQTLRNFPIQKLYGEVVIVRFDSALLLKGAETNSSLACKALSTIRYLHDAGAKIILVGNWGHTNDSLSLSTKSLADHLSSVLQLKVVPANGFSGFTKSEIINLENDDLLLLDNMTKFKEEPANCSEFAIELTSGANIFVNDAFSVSHKILASTVGVTRSCYASVAGFHFEVQLSLLLEIVENKKHPYIAIVGGRNFIEKASALNYLASKCDGLLFVGILAFQIMHALGLRVPSCFLEHNTVGEALKLIHLAQDRNIPIYFPNDFWCVKDCNPELLEVFPSNAILPGWTPVDLGPLSLKDIACLLSKCEKILWIGPVKFGSAKHGVRGPSELASILERVNKSGCDIFVIGNAACKAVTRKTHSRTPYKILESASVVWEFLARRTLPGVAALDIAYPFNLDWNTIFACPKRPLIVDIGSGNGLFILKMARTWRDSNFLGLEINKKLVKRCLNNVLESGARNMHFISTNATSTFHSIVSSYPGDLVVVAIQCPNPDFNREEYRWRMVQRSLVEAIIDLLAVNGKIFLQSDIESVTTKMMDQFLQYGKDKLAFEGDDDNGWIKENPFGVCSDWEQHVIDRGDSMFRIMLRKVR